MLSPVPANGPLQLSVCHCQLLASFKEPLETINSAVEPKQRDLALAVTVGTSGMLQGVPNPFVLLDVFALIVEIEMVKAAN